jgi:hypothetical protein
LTGFIQRAKFEEQRGQFSRATLDVISSPSLQGNDHTHLAFCKGARGTYDRIQKDGHPTMDLSQPDQAQALQRQKQQPTGSSRRPCSFLLFGPLVLLGCMLTCPAALPSVIQHRIICCGDSPCPFNLDLLNPSTAFHSCALLFAGVVRPSRFSRAMLLTTFFMGSMIIFGVATLYLVLWARLPTDPHLRYVPQHLQDWHVVISFWSPSDYILRSCQLHPLCLLTISLPRPPHDFML